MASSDRAALEFTAEEAYTGAFSELVKPGTDLPVDVTSTLVVDAVQVGQGCTVTVIGGERGTTYDLTGTLTNAAGRRWSLLLTILVVA